MYSKTVVTETKKVPVFTPDDTFALLMNKVNMFHHGRRRLRSLLYRNNLQIGSTLREAYELPSPTPMLQDLLTGVYNPFDKLFGLLTPDADEIIYLE